MLTHLAFVDCVWACVLSDSLRTHECSYVHFPFTMLFSFCKLALLLSQVPATKLNTLSKPNLGQSVTKYDLLVWFEISELEPTGE